MKKFLQIASASFSACVLFFACFSRMDIMIPLTDIVVIQLFMMNVTIAALMSLYEFLASGKDVSLPADVVVRALICYVVVGVEGVLMGMFPLEWEMLIYISIVLVPTFIASYLITYFGYAAYADDINKKIRMREGGKKEE